MKSILITICFLLVSLISYSQINVAGVDINTKTDISIIEVDISGTTGLVNILIDYGQKIRAFKVRKDAQVLDTSQKMKTFQSEIAAANYLEQNGWKLFEVLKRSPETNTFTAIFKRK